MRRVLSSLAALVVGLVAFTGGSIAPASASARVSGDAAKSFTRVAIDPDVYAFLQAVGVDIDPTGKATAGPYKGTFAVVFPITSIKRGGTLVKHTGGAKFAAGATNLASKNYTIDTKKATVSGVVTGSAVGNLGRIPLYTLSESSRPDLGDYSVALTQEAADAFNATFGDGAVSEGDVLGYATVKP